MKTIKKLILKLMSIHLFKLVGYHNWKSLERNYTIINFKIFTFSAILLSNISILYNKKFIKLLK